ncbi:TetR family transcriptional regulator [Nocardioides sp. Y6]|uniref:TetR family transcriptional regulator n=1 Tax=Nocardioides malaquae TaxID=2773426 RepID=A0ABR9RT77_9ACTN|nr:TetR family transcriptional regulator [Nocardioides malaquae]MBE7324764.1 TetR family transcriptional regulator [Nocardioides malaquae]
MTEHVPGAAPGAALRSARESRGVSLRALARQLGVSPATLSAQETGRTPLTVQRLAQAAQLLDVPLSRLAEGRLTLVGAEGRRTHPRPEERPGRDWRAYPDLGLDPILAAALEVFVEKGFHGATMRDVAAAAGLSVAGVYHHHASKADLLIDLFDRAMVEIRWRVVAARDQTEGEVEKFGAMVEALALVHVERRHLVFLGASEMRGLPAGERARFAGLRSGVQALLDDQAVRAVTAAGGVEDPETLRTRTRAIASMCTSLPSWFREGGATSPSEVAREYARLALAMLGI